MKVFLTDDTGLAAYLHLRGVRVLEGTVANPENRRRRFFVFETHEIIPRLKDEFYARSPVLLSPLEYTEARTYISRFLKLDLDKSKYALNDTMS